MLGYRCGFGVDLVVIRFIMVSVVPCGFGVFRFSLGLFCFLVCVLWCRMCLVFEVVVSSVFFGCWLLYFCWPVLFCVMSFGLQGWCLCG